MQSPDSTFSAFKVGDEPPIRLRPLLLLAIILTLAAASAGLLIGGA
jgi:hypothetical protein